VTTNIEVGRALAAPSALRGQRVGGLAEDQWFDRKSIRVTPQRLADLEVGFANADGGTIVIGVAEDGTVQGTDTDPDRRNKLTQVARTMTVPPVRAHPQLVDCLTDTGQGDQLLVIDIEPSELVHANQRDEVYLRSGDQNRKLTFHERQELAYDKGQAYFEATPATDATLDDLDEDLLGSYASALQVDDWGRLLHARNLIKRRGDVTAAAVLLFGKTPQAFYPQAYVRVLQYEGHERGAGKNQGLLQDITCEGPIPIVLAEARDAIARLQPTRRALGPEGRFEQVPLIPEDAWLEGLVNAVTHRSYSLGGDHIRVDIFQDRIEVESPGRFPGLISLKDPFNTTRFARNPRIARVCIDLNFGQELGEGIRRIYEEMRNAGLADPAYKETSGSVRLTLLSLPLDRDTLENLPRGSGAVLVLLRRAGPLGTGEIVERSGRSRPYVLKRLYALEQAGLVEWAGKSRQDPRALWAAPLQRVPNHSGSKLQACHSMELTCGNVQL